ncbi:hypothetical protein J1D01_17135 [Seonamhaeicola sp. NFXS20]|uniref:hypothetical protein n=1 Tax=Seonamhaeicola sp. NFXS20 TaxID=2816959 RepID=UPI003B8D679F
MKKTKQICQLILSISVLLIFGCSNNSDDEKSKETFLQKYNGTVWVSENQQTEVFYLVKNDILNPIPDFFKLTNSSDCFIMSEFDTDFDEITINEADKLEIYSDYGTNEYYTYTFTVIGDNKIHYKKNEFYNNSTYVIEYDLIKTNLSENDLKPICEN